MVADEGGQEGRGLTQFSSNAYHIYFHILFPRNTISGKTLKKKINTNVGRKENILMNTLTIFVSK